MYASEIGIIVALAIVVAILAWQGTKGSLKRP